MRFCLWIFIFLCAGPVRSDDVAKVLGSSSPSFNERFALDASYSGKTCSLGKMCPDTPYSADWHEQLTNIDLLKEMLAAKKIPPNPDPIVVIDTAFDPEVIAQMDGKIKLANGEAQKSDKLLDHGSGTAGMVHQTEPDADIKFVAAMRDYEKDEKPIDSAKRLLATLLAIRNNCKKGEIISLSMAFAPTDTFFDHVPGFYEELTKKGCIVVLAASNEGGFEKDVFLTVGALNRAGALAQFKDSQSGQGNIRAAGDRVRVPSVMFNQDACGANTRLGTGTSFAVPQVSAVLDMLKRILLTSPVYREQSDEKKAQILVYILRVSEDPSQKMDAYKAGLVAQEFAKLEKWPGSDGELAVFRKAIDQEHSRLHNVAFGSCVKIADCLKRKTCYDDERKWLSTATGEATASKKIVGDLLVTAHNTGDFELAQSWAQQAGMGRKDIEKEADWKQLRLRAGKMKDLKLLEDYLRAIYGTLPIPKEILNSTARAH